MWLLYCKLEERVFCSPGLLQSETCLIHSSLSYFRESPVEHNVVCMWACRRCHRRVHCLCSTVSPMNFSVRVLCLSGCRLLCLGGWFWEYRLNCFPRSPRRCVTVTRDTANSDKNWKTFLWNSVHIICHTEEM